MARTIKGALASFWRAFFVFAVGLRMCAAGPGVTPPSSLAQVDLPDAAEAQRILRQFRQSGIAGGYYLEFELRQLPRRGETTILPGKLWGSRNEVGAVIRIVLTDSARGEHRLLLQNGPQAAAWQWAGGKAEPLRPGALFAPIVPGVQLSAFDLQMPFLFWPDARVVGISRIRGRPAHAFLFHPPPANIGTPASVAAVRSFFDTQFNAPTQTELLDQNGGVTKTFALLELKKISGQYIPQAFEVRDEASRDKTRLVVVAAALNLELPDRWFTPALLGSDPAPVSPVRLEP